jgi:predicted NBD/HSP70 family sugar kinase
MATRRSSLGQLKQLNEWRVIDALRRLGDLSRAELVAATGLSRSTISNVVATLQERAIIDERPATSTAPPGPGRPGATVGLRSQAGIAVGIAVDRENLRVAAVDLAGRVLTQRAEPVSPDTRGTAVIARAAEVVRAIVDAIGVRRDRVVGIGVGLPGPVDIAHGGVAPTSTLRRWAGLDVRAQLSAALDVAHVFPDNDANLGALGELQHGAGRGVENLIYLRVGPGVGGGLILGGQLYRGDDGYAGQIGHITAVADGKPCPCGRRGCLSTLASSWAVAGELEHIHGPELSAARIVSLADGGDREARTALHEAGTHTGRVLAALVNTLNPARIILGGELGARSEDLLAGAREALATNIQPVASKTLSIVHAELGDRSEVLGAAARVLHDEAHVSTFMAGV